MSSFEMLIFKKNIQKKNKVYHGTPEFMIGFCSKQFRLFQGRSMWNTPSDAPKGPRCKDRQQEAARPQKLWTEGAGSLRVVVVVDEKPFRILYALPGNRFLGKIFKPKPWVFHGFMEVFLEKII